jgi:hypothetical protein
MRQLPTESLKTESADDLWGLKVLKLGGVGACLGGKSDETLGAFEFTIVIRRNVGDKIRW